MAVITISREFGSGGDEVASRLCEVLGYHSFGKDQILKAVQETSFARINAIDYSEDNHEIQTFIVGRGGQVLLRDAPGVLHVRIEAPFEVRLKRVMEQLRQVSGSERKEDEIRRKAGDLIASRNISSADYIQRYYQVDWADRQLYHLVLNLGRLSIEQAVHMIVTAVQCMENHIPPNREPEAGPDSVTARTSP
jgi:cytidylate kinase